MNLKLFFMIFITLFFLSTSSLLCRAALIDGDMDAYSFTFFRLLSGAVVLLFLSYFKNKKIEFALKKNWLSSFMLFVYAISFSYSYLSLDAGLGALILFAIVQLTIIIVAIILKEKVNVQKIFGISIAFMGLVYLLFPRESFELSLPHAFLMMLSGLAWGFYTVLGKKSTNALIHTSENFVKSLVFIVIFYLFFVDTISMSSNGIILAIISGGVTSALGYTLWYTIVPKIDITTSGVIQLIVPPIAILQSILFLDEKLTFTLFLSTVVILIGIFIALVKKKSSNE